MAEPWTECDDAMLRRMIATHSFAEIARAVGRTQRACETRASVIGVKRGLRPLWTDADIAALRRMFPVMSSAEVADALGRSETAVKEKAVMERLRKSDAYMATVQCRRRTVARERATAMPRTRARPPFLQGRAGRFERAGGDYGPVQDAVAHLRKIGPIWRCTAEGVTDPQGDHWKFSGRVLDAAAVEARAERAGWVRP